MQKCPVTPLEFTTAVMDMSLAAEIQKIEWMDTPTKDKAKVLLFYEFVRVHWKIKVLEGEEDFEEFRPPQEIGKDPDEFASQVLRSYLWLSYA